MLFDRRTMLVALAAAPAARAAVGRAEFIYETAPFPECHASTIVEIKPGELLAAWFGGTEEKAPDVAIWTARRVNGKWTTPEEVVREPKIPTWNPVLYFLKDGRLCLNYKVGPSPQTWTSANKYSTDGGRTWTAPELLPAGLLGPIKNKPLVLPNGTILAGTSTESYKTWACWVERSTDNGKTWTKHGPIVVPGEIHGIIQPSIVPLRGGKLLRMYVRSTQRIGKVCYADSTDGGRTWSEAKPTSLPNPNSGTDAVGLKDGRVVLVYNHTPKGRSPLNVAVSKDGDTWSAPLVLESEPGEYSYPAVIQGADGTVHITYTWKRKRVKYVALALNELA